MNTDITPHRLGTLFRPDRVALVGASNKSTFSALAYRNLVEFGFSDRTHLVNRRGVEVHGRSTVTSCSAIGEDVDVAFILVPQAGTLDALTEAAQAGIRNAVVLASGYGEAGEAGRLAQQQLVEHARSLDMVVLGPNHLGFANFVDRVPVTPVPDLPERSGRVALLSQSGASSSAMVDLAGLVDADLSYLVTLGNEAMITAGHVLDFLVEDDHTDAIAIFMETVREPGVFRAAAQRAAAAGKAIVVLKAGSSVLSARTAAAHTGALVGDDRTISAIFAELGIIRVDSIEDMMITAGAAAKLGRLRTSGIGIVSISGGACDIVADRAEELGAAIPGLSAETEKRLAAIMPDYGTVQNPLDVTGAALADPSLFTRAIDIISRDTSIGVVGVINTLPWQGDGPYSQQAFADAIGAGATAAATPVVYINQVLQPITDYTRQIMTAAAIPFTIPGLRQATVALRNVAWWSDVTRGAAHPAPIAEDVAVTTELPKEGSWSEATARGVLAQAGIRVIPAGLVTSADQAAKAAATFDGPVVLKIASPDILHKSDIGGVVLGVEGDDDVRKAFDAVTTAAATRMPEATVEGVLISPMRAGGFELLIGVARDPQWGLILAVAIGGVFVEVLNDAALSTLPVDRDKARSMLTNLRGASLLEGVRGFPPADLDELAAVISRIGALALKLGDRLESLEVNPLRVYGDTIEALDAIITWTPRD
jgi:acetate---CoA ligase (ADP-forming)